MDTPYSSVLTQLMMNAEQAQFDKKYMKFLEKDRGGG